MNLDETQRKQVAAWIEEGLKLAEIQKRIETQWGIRPTYLDVRLLVDDLKLVPKDPPPPPAPKATAKKRTGISIKWAVWDWPRRRRATNLPPPTSRTSNSPSRTNYSASANQNA
jgi:hypothetical protein